MRRIIARLAVLALVSSIGQACTRAAKRTTKTTTTNKKTTSTANTNPLTKFMGNDVSSGAYDQSSFSLDRFVSSPDELSCDFDLDGGGNCCWGNVDPPLDDLQWMQGGGNPDGRFPSLFSSSRTPSGNFLYAGRAAPESADTSAIFASCPIDCAEASVSVTFSHWTTTDAVIDACIVRRGTLQLTDCTRIERSATPGPSTVHFAPTSDFHIVIVARNFVRRVAGEEGGMAIIDDISVNFECQEPDYYVYPDGYDDTTTRPTPRPQPPRTQPPPAPPAVDPLDEECSLVDCDFASNSCGWFDGGEDPGARGRGFEKAQGRYQNPLTGIKTGPDGTKSDSYSAAFLDGFGSSAILGVDVPGGLADRRVIRFNRYAATDSLVMKGCCGSADNCPFSTSDRVRTSDKGRWKEPRESAFACPKGTRQIFILCENMGANQGACGVDNIELLEPGASPAASTRRLC